MAMATAPLRREDLVGGIHKYLQKGRAEPDAVRFHVPVEGGEGFAPVTWGEVLERATEVALWLDAVGVGAGTKVAVFATTRVEWGWVVPAIEAVRAVFVPVYFSNTADQVQYIVDQSDAEVLFVELALLPKVLERWDDYPKLRHVVVWGLESKAALAELVAAHNAGRPVPLDPRDVAERVRGLGAVQIAGRAFDEADPGRIDALAAAIREDDLAAIIYTSGTTGVPKGAMLTNKNLWATTWDWYQALADAVPPPGQRRDILWLPISHMAGWGILGQGTIFEYETWLSDPYRMLAILPVVRPTMLFSVPAYWDKLYTLARNASDDPAEQHAELRRLTGGCLRFLLSGGAGLKREIKDFFAAAGMPMIEGYGLTECAPNVTMNRVSDYDYDTVGKPMPGVTVKIADDGEILVKGDNVFPGYYKQPEATAEVFDADGWFHTGDLGEWTDRGFVRFKGRKKEIIATAGGKKIGPAGIEAAFVGSPWIEHVVLYGNERKYLVALITPNEGALRALARERGWADEDYAALVARDEVRALIQAEVDAVNARLARYETIKRFHLHPGHLSVEAGHLTPSLKLRRKQVWADFADVFEGLYA